MGLTRRELAVADRYAGGETYKEVSAALGVAPATVRNHLAAVYRKLEVRNKAELNAALSSRRSEFGVLPPTEVPARTASDLKILDSAGPLSPVGASIAVLPFKTLGSADGDYLGYGFAADIQHDLTQCHDLLVSGRSSCLTLENHSLDPKLVSEKLGVQYLLWGTLRSEHRRIRLIVELLDGPSGAVLWSERFDGDLNDVLAIQADIAGAIAASLSLQISQVQLDRRHHIGPDHLTAYDLRLRGNRLLEIGGRANLEKAREHFARAIELEPGSAAAYAGLSMCYGYRCDLLLTENYADCWRQHFELAERAVEVNETDSRGHYATACALMLSGQYELADNHAARGLQLNPSEYHNLCNRGYSLMALGRIDESLAYFSQSLRRNPLAPNSCLLALGLIEYLDSNYGQAARALSNMTGYQVQRASTLAAACAQVGYKNAARSAAVEFQRLSEDIPIRPAGSSSPQWLRFWRRAYPYLNDDAFSHILEGLRKAALPV